MKKVKFVYLCPDKELHLASAYVLFGRPFWKKDDIIVDSEGLDRIITALAEEKK